MTVVLLSALWFVGWNSGRRLIYNATDSVPRGWYLTKPVRQPIARSELVLFPVPAHVAGLVAQRRWLSRHVPLLKQVGAVAGDRVCVDTVLRVRGDVVGPVLSQDTAGRPLPVVRRGCFTVSPGFVFPVSASLANSFDARYFGEVLILPRFRGHLEYPGSARVEVDDGGTATTLHVGVQGGSGSPGPGEWQAPGPGARDLGIRADMRRDWRRQVEARARAGEPGAPGAAGSAEEEVRRLRRETEGLRQERDFLKKAAAFFATESR